MEPQLCHNCQHLCQHWFSIYLFLICCVINNLYNMWYHLMSRLYLTILVCPDLKDISFIKFFLRYICQKLELMNQKSYVGNTRYLHFNNERKEDLFVVMCQLQNINQDKIQKCMFILLLHDSRWYIFVGILCQNFVESSISGGLIPCNFFSFCKAIITIELYLGSIRPIGLIYINLF